MQINQESTKRQYALKEKAVALGWTIDQITVIDQDQGQSGAQTTLREGFQYLVSQVSLAKAGIVMGLEVSRLARNSSDWHRLLELCALTNTLILDEDGIYNPCDFNDRLVLGLKGTMSEAELHMIKARLRGGTLSKAKRGELKVPLPIGFVYNEKKEIVLDPDKQIQDLILQLFHCFERAGSACAVVKIFEQKGWLFPQKLVRGINKGDVLWGKITHTRVLQILHNPHYAGIFAFGRRQTQYSHCGKKSPRVMPKEDWHVFIVNAHAAYITAEQYEKNQQQLKNNIQPFASGRDKGPPREGNALLQGILLCGYCGQRMTIRYHMKKGKPSPDYICQKEGIKHGQPRCQSIVGEHIDKAIGETIISMMSPMTLEICIAVQKELEQRWQESDKLWEQQLERARYESELAKRRYMKVDPDNRLVASGLEADWNDKLKYLNELHEEYDSYRKQKFYVITNSQEKKLLDLSNNFSSIWSSEDTPMKERKRMLRLLISDITLKKTKHNIEVHILFAGGQTKSLSLPLPKNAAKIRRTSTDIIKKINELTSQHTDSEIVEILNEQGYKPSCSNTFNLSTVQRLRHHYGIKNYHDKLCAKGLLIAKELAIYLNVSTPTIYKWRRHELIKGYLVNNKGTYLFEKPANHELL
jgi:DNA invertase Pin-like site-specific DNA recombinase